MPEGTKVFILGMKFRKNNSSPTTGDKFGMTEKMKGDCLDNSSDKIRYDPSTELPRDETGSYLHLKLKRFPSINDVTMPFAIKTWTEHPQDAEIDYASSSRSKCRHCHSMIHKGELRVRLWLQCHKGCKNSAYFHGGNCIWHYPETSKIKQVSEFIGLDDLTDEEKKYVADSLGELKIKKSHECKRTQDEISTLDDKKQPHKKARSDSLGQL